MANEYKQCPNGHYYQGATCPYCKSNGNGAGNTTTMKTEIFGGSTDGNAPTAVNINNGGGETIPMGGGTMVNPQGSSPAPNRTVFGLEDEDGMPGAPTSGYRETRKLVGWLVTYSLDPMGVDFKLYEGRNIIGRDMDCNITVNDNMVSSKHAVLLFRANKYSITDSQSSHGTFVNGNDIDLEPVYLKDGDKIRVGKTEFLFRKSF